MPANANFMLAACDLVHVEGADPPPARRRPRPYLDWADDGGKGDSVVRVSIDGWTGEIGRAATRARAANGCRSALHGAG